MVKPNESCLPRYEQDLSGSHVKDTPSPFAPENDGVKLGSDEK